MDLENIKEDMKKIDKEYENLKIKSREIVRLSKKVIYALHRGERVSLKEIESKVAALKKQVAKCPEIGYAGGYKVAMQEYVEAAAYHYFLKNKKLIPISDVKVESEHYLLGLCDLVGELNRKAVNSAIKEDYEMTLLIKDFVSALYGEFLDFDFKNGELRRKFDGIKYELKKLENLVLELKLKNKV